MRKRSISILALVLALAFTGYVFLMMQTVNPAPGMVFYDKAASIEIPQSDTALGGLFYEPLLNDTLPYYEYRRLNDSLKSAKELRQQANRSIGSASVSIEPIGVYRIKRLDDTVWENKMSNQFARWIHEASKEVATKQVVTKNKDSMRLLAIQMEHDMEKVNKRYNDSLIMRQKEAGSLYYLGLNNYTLDHNNQFFIQDGKYKLAYVKWDSMNGTGYGHYEQKPLRVRYSAEQQLVYIPISQRTHNILDGASKVIMACLIFAFVYFYVGLPVQILINISKGKAFDERNIRRLHLMARITLAIALVRLFLPYSLRFAFRNYIPDEMVLRSFGQSLFINSWIFIVAVAIFITAKAFEKGNKLQKEQDLTI